jgi:hypothetical protein
LKTLDDLITNNIDLRKQTESLMILSLATDAKAYYGKGDMKSLISLLMSTTPMISLLINIEISNVNTLYMDEGGTLS